MTPATQAGRATQSLTAAQSRSTLVCNIRARYPGGATDHQAWCAECSEPRPSSAGLTATRPPSDFWRVAVSTLVTSLVLSHSRQTDKIKIRVDASTPGSAPKQTSPNAAKPTRISSDSFEGDILVRIKDFTGESADGAAKLNPADGYFADDGERRGKTWSIFVRGRFLEEVNGQFSIHGVSADEVCPTCWLTICACLTPRSRRHTLRQYLRASDPRSPTLGHGCRTQGSSPKQSRHTLALADPPPSALQFLRLIDNQLQQDFYADKPWALCGRYLLSDAYS